MPYAPQVDCDAGLTMLGWQQPDIVERYRREQREAPEAAGACFAAFKQFMVVCGTSSEPRAPSPPIDAMWHVALLFTRSYRQVCLDSFGRFIDHHPVAAPVDWTMYAGTRIAAEQLFGELDARYWIRVSHDADCNGTSCEEPLADCRGCVGGKSIYLP